MPQKKEPNRVEQIDQKETPLGGGRTATAWRVFYLNRECARIFLARGQADAYLEQLITGVKNPDWI